MSQQEKIPFLDMFPFCQGLSDMCGGLGKTKVESVVINHDRTAMSIAAEFPRTAAPAELHTIEGRIQTEYGLHNVNITPLRRETFPRPQTKAQNGKEKKPGGSGKVIYGRAIKGSPVDMDTINSESGNVIVQGEIFDVQSRDIVKRGGWVLSFDMTDYKSSIKVSKYFRADDDLGELKNLKKGMYVTVAGNVSYNRYDEDIALEPRNIVLGK